MAKGYVRLDQMRDDIVHIYCDSDLENGMIVQKTNERSADGISFKVGAVSDVTDKHKEILLHCSVPENYEEGGAFDEFVLDSGKIGRAYELHKNDFYFVSSNMITSYTTVAKDDILVPVDGSFKLAEKETALADEIVAFKVLDTETIGSIGTSQINGFILGII